jgi:hypothetical protein
MTDDTSATPPITIATTITANGHSIVISSPFRPVHS